MLVRERECCNVHVKCCISICILIKGMMLFPEDESGESSQQEEEESEAGETDEQEAEDYILNDEQLERRRCVFVLFVY